MRRVFVIGFLFIPLFLSAERYVVIEYAGIACNHGEDFVSIAEHVAELEEIGWGDEYEFGLIDFGFRLGTEFGCMFLDVGTQIEKIADVDIGASNDGGVIFPGYLIGETRKICRNEDGECIIVDLSEPVMFLFFDEDSLVRLKE